MVSAGIVREPSAAPQPPDTVVTGARVIDPRHGIDAVLDIGLRDGRVAALAPTLPRGPDTRVHEATGAIAVPGLIDLHAHVYARATSYGVDPDQVGPISLAATLVDAGSAGAGSYEGLRDFVIARSRTRVLAWLNIAFPGIFAFDSRVMVGEAALPALLDVERCVETTQRHADTVIGIKVRLGGPVSGEVGLLALERALQAAQRTGLPVMCHVGRPPPTYAEIVDRLRAGDVLTHCLRPAPNAPVDAHGQVWPALRRARERGVLFDVGHGMGSFGFDSTEAALAAGFAPDTVSSDVHALSVGGPAFDLLHTMNKLLNCGIALPALVAMVTDAPARAMRRPDLGHLGAGAPGDITLLRLAQVPLRYTDSTGAARDGVQLLRPVGLLREGHWHAPLPRPWEMPRGDAAGAHADARGGTP